jgi:hypothetical protein
VFVSVQNVGDKDEVMVRYLLGELSAEERRAVEEQYFHDDQLFEEFLAAEGELIDGYVQGQLPEEVREKFEAQFLATPEGRRKVELSRAVMSAMLEEPAQVAAAHAEAETATEAEARPSWWQSLWQRGRSRNRVWQLSFAALALFFVLGVPWLAVENLRLRSRLRSTEASLQQKEREAQQLQEQEAAKLRHQQQQEAQLRTDVQQLNEALERKQNELSEAEQLARTLREEQRRQAPQPRGSTGSELSTSIATYVLPFNLVRGVGQQSDPLIISPGQRAVRFRVDLGRTDHPAYRISLQTVDGAEVWGGVIKKARRTAAGTSITFLLPTNIFNRQDYILTVTPPAPEGQAESVADYSFKVLRKE